MGYPFILSYSGDEFARVNYDGVWSVKWEKAIQVRYEPLTLRNRAIVGCATVLVAARDNFVTTSWADSDAASNKWEHNAKVIDLREADPDPAEIQFKIANAGDVCARVNYDGSWSIIWDQVDVVARTQKDNWRTLALARFCHLLLAARDRFPVSPWNVVVKDEDE